jgi:hypothetical protein
MYLHYRAAPSSSNGALSTGAIAGIVLSIVVIAMLFATGVWRYCKRFSANRASNGSSPFAVLGLRRLWRPSSCLTTSGSAHQNTMIADIKYEIEPVLKLETEEASVDFQRAAPSTAYKMGRTKIRVRAHTTYPESLLIDTPDPSMTVSDFGASDLEESLAQATPRISTDSIWETHEYLSFGPSSGDYWDGTFLEITSGTLSCEREASIESPVFKNYVPDSSKDETMDNEHSYRSRHRNIVRLDLPSNPTELFCIERTSESNLKGWLSELPFARSSVNLGQDTVPVRGSRLRAGRSKRPGRTPSTKFPLPGPQQHLSLLPRSGKSSTEDQIIYHSALQCSPRSLQTSHDKTPNHSYISRITTHSSLSADGISPWELEYNPNPVIFAHLKASTHVPLVEVASYGAQDLPDTSVYSSSNVNGSSS